MRTIKGQIVTSTTLDLKGDKITKEELEALFEQMPEEQALNQDHDLSKPIVGRMYNKRLVPIENGEFAIKVDIDVFDEDVFATRGGFSIAFKRRLYTINENREAEVEILFNPEIIDSEDIIPLVISSSRTTQIDAVELIQKGLDTIAIIVLVFASSSIAGEFFKKIGADVYDLLKAKLREMGEKYRAKGKAELRFHFQFTAKLGANSVDVLIESDTDNVSVISQQSLLIEPLLNQVSAYADGKEIGRVSIRVNKDVPYLEITHIVGRDGKAVKLLELNSNSLAAPNNSFNRTRN